MSGSRRSRSQGVLEPRAPLPSHPGHHYHHHHHHQRRPHQPQRQQRLRNPWVAHESHSTSSSSGRTHHKTRPVEPPAPLRMDHSMGPRFLQPTFYGLPPSGSPPPPERPLLPAHHVPTLIPAQPQPTGAHPPHGGDSASTGSPTAPGSSNSRCDGAGDGGAAGGEGSGGGWSGGGCGGQCPALDEFCFHCLRVAFVAGTATGIGLVVAGAVLRLRLMVLVYIGGLTAFVSLILLGVHCCVRRDDAVRRRRLRELQK
ncbi:cbp/p300-interacting transactivator 2-like, partial [Hetaerina americana]|uniref:cbp/p300-interacting transactivator 2-like n=1 Tax=Hetaerina americana TaxID=62018 RepID=UPI003A7F269B